MVANPLISVIVPIYKVEEYLRECVDSILDQTYLNLEIILVNDGSPDNCGHICDEYAKQDNRIVVIHKENGGLSDARNAGLDVCKGEYIAFVDSDDMIHPQFIEILYQNLMEHKADISFCDFVRFTNESKFENSLRQTNFDVEVFDGDFMINNLYTKEWVPKNVVVWNKLYHHSIFKTLRFPKGLNHEDEYIFLDVYKNNSKVVYYSFVGYLYRLTPNSIMANNTSEKNVMSIINTLDNRLLFFKTKSNYKLYNKTINKMCYYIMVDYLNGRNRYINRFNRLELIYNIIIRKRVHWKTKVLFIYKLVFKC